MLNIYVDPDPEIHESSDDQKLNLVTINITKNNECSTEFSLRASNLSKYISRRKFLTVKKEPILKDVEINVAKGKM